MSDGDSRESPDRESSGHVDEGDTTAAAAAPAKSMTKRANEDDDEEDRTIRQAVDPKVRTASRKAAVGVLSEQDPKRSASPTAPAVAPKPPPNPPLRITSKKMTAVGLGPVFSPKDQAPPATKPAATLPLPSGKTTPSKPQAPPAAPPPPRESEADEPDDSITATAPVPRASANLALAVPGPIKITEAPRLPPSLEQELGDDPNDETEVRTVVSAPAMDEILASSPPPAAGRPPTPPPSPRHEADEPDDSVTTQSPSPLADLPSDDEPKTSPPMLAPPIPAAGRRAEVITAQAPDDDEDAYEADESVTTRGPAVDFPDDSAITQAPITSPAPGTTKLPTALGSAPLFEETDGTTKKVARRKTADDQPSVTSEAPAGHLTNMLRVIAGGEVEAEDDDDSTENRTAVMANAPVKPMSSGAVRAAPRFPVISPLGGGRNAAIADLRSELREPSSDSGLRVARAEAPSGDHASVRALFVGTALDGARTNEIAQGALPEEAQPNPFAATVVAPPARDPRDLSVNAKKPRYGLVVGIVATLSFAIPLLLFLWLQAGAATPPPRERAEAVPELTPREDPPRSRAGKASSSTSPANAKSPWGARRH